MQMIIYQIFGTIATIISILALLCKKKKTLMNMQLISNLLFSVQYWLINALSASYVTLIAILRSILFSNEKAKHIKLSSLISLALIAGYFSYDGTILSLIPILNSIICICGASLNNIKHYKVVYGICSAIWIYYNYRVGATVIIIANIFEILSAIIGYYRHE